MQENSQNRFYDIYWKSRDDAPPEHDPDTPKKLQFLFDTLNAIGPESKRILDAGCGAGLVAGELGRAGSEVTGIDISSKAIASARSRYLGIRFVEGSLDTRWPFDDGEFDVVYSFDVIEHILNTSKYISETNRALKPGGLFVLTTPFHALIKNLLLVLFDFDRHFCDIKGGHIRFFSDGFLKNILEEFGFQVLRWRYYGRLWPIPKGVYVVSQKIYETQE